MASTISGMSSMMSVGSAGPGLVETASSGTLSGIQGLQTAGAVLTSLASAGSKFMEARTASGFASLDAGSQQLAAQSKALDIKDRMLRTLASQRVAFAASGVDISSGTPVVLADATAERGRSDIAIARSNGDIGAALARYKGQQQSSRAINKGIGSVVRAGNDFVRTATSLRRRG